MHNLDPILYLYHHSTTNNVNAGFVILDFAAYHRNAKDLRTTTWLRGTSCAASHRRGIERQRPSKCQCFAL